MTVRLYLINWTNNQYFYVGQTVNFSKRKSQHLFKLKKGTHHNPKLQNVFNKYGMPQFHIIEECSIEELDEREQFYLDLLFDEPDCLNVARYVASPGRGRKHTLQAKQKISKSRLGNQFHKGMKHSEDTRKKMSEKSKGRRHSIEAKQKISDNQKKPVFQYSKSGEFICEWTSRKDVEKSLGINARNICACLYGKRKTAGGFVWKGVQQ